jgi:L-amino acid N-acyltransferase YncA
VSIRRLVRENWPVVRTIYEDGIASGHAENEPSLELHRRCGFRVVGVRGRIGRLDGVWRDVVLMERRSEEVS